MTDKSNELPLDSKIDGLIKFVWISIVLALSIYICFAIYNQWVPAHNPELMGSFGDFIGGVLNPIIAFASILLLAKVYQLQKTELRESRKIFEDMYSQNESDIKKKEIKDVINNLEDKINVVLSKTITFEPNSDAYKAFHNPDNRNIRRTNLQYVILNFDKSYDYSIYEEGDDIFSTDIKKYCNELISLFSDLRFYVKLYQLEKHGELYSDYIRDHYSHLIFLISSIIKDPVSDIIYKDFASAGDREYVRSSFNEKKQPSQDD